MSQAFTLADQAYDKFESFDFRTAISLYEQAAVTAGIQGDQKNESLFNLCGFLIFCAESLDDFASCAAKLENLQNQLSSKDKQFLVSVLDCTKSKNVEQLLTALMQRDSVEAIPPQVCSILVSLKKKMQNNEDYCEMI